jgi:hypothetical protein
VEEELSVAHEDNDEGERAALSILPAVPKTVENLAAETVVYTRGSSNPSSANPS